jgi:hypothetical protein
MFRAADPVFLSVIVSGELALFRGPVKAELF